LRNLFFTKNDHFAKTGSGQTYGKLKTEMRFLIDATAAANVAECCSRCKANTKCEVFELGHGGCVAENCTSKTVNCFLIGGFTGQTNPNNDRAFGCVRGSVAPEPPAAAAAGVEQNNTVAAFMSARGASAMLEVTCTLPLHARTFSLTHTHTHIRRPVLR
jgi:hypothetical protein